MRSRKAEQPITGLSLLPFLDIIFSSIGIFIIVFVLQNSISNTRSHALAVDALVICTSDHQVDFYPDRHAKPVHFNDVQISLLFDSLVRQDGHIRNLVFAFTRNCFESRWRFENEFSKFTALFYERQNEKVTFHLAFRPLSTQPDAVLDLLAMWRGEGDKHAQE